MIKRMLARMRRKPRGQSFLELVLVVMILALLLVGVVEFGFMLNNYLHVLDGAREAARYSSANIAFSWDNSTNPVTLVENPSFYYIASSTAAATMDPVILNPANPDDIVISVFSVSGTANTIMRFPSADPNGWSLCNHYAAFKASFPSGQVPSQLSNTGWSSGCTVQPSQLSKANIQSRMDASAPNTGVLLVEVYYNYPQLLKLFSHIGFMGVNYSIIPDPIPLYVYTVMPLSSAEPTQVP
jgi:TadE-like protein.